MTDAFRLQPAMGVEAYQTYTIYSPRDTDVVSACQDADCQSWRHGWQTLVDEGTELGARQAAYIRTRSGRTFTESRTADALTVFKFPAKQRCFAEHRTRGEVYARSIGDHRGLRDTYVHRSAADWVEDFGEHQQGIAEQLRRG